jgi:hypothetical protein
MGINAARRSRFNFVFQRATSGRFSREYFSMGAPASEQATQIHSGELQYNHTIEWAEGMTYMTDD